MVQDKRGKFRFTYDDDYIRKKIAVPLSLSMPLTAAAPMTGQSDRLCGVSCWK